MFFQTNQLFGFLHVPLSHLSHFWGCFISKMYSHDINFNVNYFLKFKRFRRREHWLIASTTSHRNVEQTKCSLNLKFFWKYLYRKKNMKIQTFKICSGISVWWWRRRICINCSKVGNSTIYTQYAKSKI